MEVKDRMGSLVFSHGVKRTCYTIFYRTVLGEKVQFHKLRGKRAVQRSLAIAYQPLVYIIIHIFEDKEDELLKYLVHSA